MRVFGDANAFLLESLTEIADFRLFSPKTVFLDELAALHAGGRRASAKFPGASLELVAVRLPAGPPSFSRNLHSSSMSPVAVAGPELPETAPV